MKPESLQRRSTREASRFLLALLTISGVAFFALPVLGLALRTPWVELTSLLGSQAVHDALYLSLLASFSSLILAVIFGLPIALWLSRGRSSLRTVARIAVMLPIVLPPIVGGVALLLAYGRGGIIGTWLDRYFQIALPFTTTATILASAYMGLPFFVLSAEAGLRSFDRRYLDMAATLGAGPTQRFFRITLPLIAPSLRVGALLCWARAMGEFCATQTFAGNLAGTTRTMPLACGVAMEVDPDLAIALSLILALFSVLALGCLRQRWQLAP